jgi:hypothetical protein
VSVVGRETGGICWLDIYALHDALPARLKAI